MALVAANFYSCTEKIDLELNEGNNVRLVVDAMLTTESKAHLVKLTLTQDYFDEEATPFAQNAVVKISDGNITENLIETEPGHYYTSDNFKGTENQSYTLSIEYEDEMYTSTSRISPVVAVDSILYDYAEATEDGGGLFDEESEAYYTLYAYFQEPATSDQYYMWKLKINGEYYTETLADWFFVSDEFVNGNYIADADFFEFDAEPGDVVEFEQFSISKETHDYFNNILLETEYRGSLFDGAPANVESNISNGALGLFICADVEKASMEILD